MLGNYGVEARPTKSHNAVLYFINARVICAVCGVIWSFDLEN
jgi:hypothetical protein